MFLCVVFYCPNFFFILILGFDLLFAIKSIIYSTLFLFICQDWREIVKLYEKENLHLAELSNRLLRNVNYEIPAIKKQITKCAQFQEVHLQINITPKAGSIYKLKCHPHP